MLQSAFRRVEKQELDIASAQLPCICKSKWRSYVFYKIGDIYMSWYAIFVETGKEETVCNRIIELLNQEKFEDEYELLVPKRNMQERHQGKFVEVTLKMFPGYVLVRSNNIDEFFRRTRNCNYLYRFLKLENDFQKIRLEEIANIIYLLDDDGVIGASNVSIENDIVKVISGPLCNYTGFIKKIDKHKRRAKVLFKFNGQDHYIDLSINFVRRVSEDEVKSEILFYRC